MKPSQSSIYRRTELLLDWLTDVVDRLPKKLSYDALGRRLINNMLDAKDYVAMALITQDDPKTRLECINQFTLCMTSAKSIVRFIFERSQKSDARTLSPKQYGYYVREMGVIGAETARWMTSTQTLIKQQKGSI